MAHARATVTPHEVKRRIEGTIRAVRTHEKTGVPEHAGKTGVQATSEPSLSERFQRAFASIAFAEAGEPETAVRMLRDSN